MIRLRFVFLAIFAAGLVAVQASKTQAQYRLEKHDGGVRVLEEGKLVADYLIRNGSKPIIWPLIGIAGERMTREYPMVADSKDEAHDHIHHRSLWFTQDEVNGVNFWAEGEKAGVTVHKDFTTLSDGKHAVIATVNAWNDPTGKTILTDARRFTFGRGADYRWIDCEFEIRASEVDLHFGDTKEGTFAVRVAESMRTDHKKKDPSKGGTIVNSEGQTDDSAWGKLAEWVDYHGPVNGKHEGIAILNHPTSYHFPTRWHVRTYGLFAANPFGYRGLRPNIPATDGTKLAKGDKIALRYRVILHSGDEKQGKIAERFAEFAKREFKSL